MKIAVMGASGQVGAELCLFLRYVYDVDVVPISRSRMGSAYLRYAGLACRHGDPAQPEDASSLYSDCDAIVNLALPGLTGDFSAAKRTHDALIQNAMTFSRPGAVQIYSSTMSVYGDARVDQQMVISNLYAREKKRGEMRARVFAAKYEKPLFVFRLGHVCGELQGITLLIRQMITRGEIAIPQTERLSNTVYVATIADAIMTAVSTPSLAGTYDLMNVPQWTWQEVVEYEAARIGETALIVPVELPMQTSGVRQWAKRAVMRSIAKLRSSRNMDRLGGRLLSALPVSAYYRIKAFYSIRSAAAQIGSLRSDNVVAQDMFMRRPIQGSYLSNLSETRQLLISSETFLDNVEGAAMRWPADLPMAGDTAE